MKPKEHVKLSKQEQVTLEQMLNKGHQSNRVTRRVMALLALNRGQSYTEVAQTVGVTKQTVSIWAQNYHENGLTSLPDKPKPGRPKKIFSVDEAKITALACSTPPAGYSQWSLRLLAEHAVELIEADSISYGEVRRILKKMNLNRT
jgi:putative transposase